MRRALLFFALTAAVAVAGFERPAPVDAEASESLPNDIDVKRIVLDIIKGKHFDTDVAGSVTDARVLETMSGAPTFTLTIHDPDLELLASDVLFETDKDGDRELRDIDVELDNDRWYRLAKLSFGPSGQGRGVDLTLTFEHRVVALLRRYNKPRKARRSRMTRAEFVLSFAREVKGERIIFRSRDLHKKQPLAKKTKEERDSARDPGLADGEHIKIKGRRATSTQRRVVDDVLTEGDRQHARDKVLIVAIMVITQESSATNSATNGIHRGAFQQDPRYWPATRNATKDSRAFFKKAIAIDRARPSISKTELAEAVQASGQGSLYGHWEAEATRTVKAFGGSGSESRSRTKPYRFARGQRGKREDSWTAANRLADEVNWRCFVTGKRTWYFESEPNLFRSRPRIKIERGHPALLEDPSADFDKGKHSRSITVRVRMRLWTAPVGTVALVEGYGLDGRWLIESIERSLYSNEAEVVLKKPSKPKPEPRPETVTVNRDDETTGRGKAAKLYQAAQKFHGPYVYGGGHGPPLKDIGFNSGMDCSSSCAKALFEADLYGHDVALVSGAFASQYGVAGEGQQFTVWAHSGHMFIELKGLGKYKRFDTSPQGGETEHGPRVRTQMRSTAGFTPRHWPGL